MGAGSVEGSIKWWARGHRAHHRYTDTDLDPYNAHKGLLWSHIGWMIIKPRRKPGVADVSDLTRNPIIKWQHKNYILLMFLMAFALPTVVCGLGWGDWKGGYVYAGVLRLVFVHHVSLIRLTYFIQRNQPILRSLRSVLTPLLTGLATHPLTINIHPVTISSRHLSLLVKVITTFTTSSLWITAMPSDGTNMILPSGLSGLARKLASHPT